MSRSIATELPEELLKAVLVLLDDTRWGSEDMSKRGLTSCSLTCRYWARFVRPLLFRQLVLRSREDEAQLQAFLATPDFLGRSIGDSMAWLTLSYDGPASGVPWTLLRPERSLIPPHVKTFVRWRMAGGEARSGQKWPTHLLSRVLPRTPPPFATYDIFSITLLNLFIPIRDFLRSLQFLRFSRLNIENVSFDGGEDLALLQALPVLLLENGRAETPRICFIDFKGISISALPYWNTVGNLVLSTQRLQMNNRGLVESISSRLSLCVDILDTSHRTYNLFITGSLRGFWDYSLYDQHLFASISAEVLNAGATHVRSIQFRCPDLKDSARAFGAIDQLSLALANTVTAPMSRLCIVYGSTVNIRTLVCGILEERLLADPKVSSVLLRSTSGSFLVRQHAVHEIKAIPAKVALHDGTTLPLTTAQRARWLDLDNDQAREQYLAELREAAEEFGRGAEREV